MSRLVRYQLIAFVVIAVLGVVYVGGRYVHLDHMVGLGQYQVKVKMAQTGNISKGSEVTYRGVPVGTVGAQDITPDGVVVYLEMDSSKPKVPSDAKAVVADRSA